MLFEYAQATRGQSVMIVGAAGNVGAYAVQMALDAGMSVIAVGRTHDEDLLRSLGATNIVDSGTFGSAKDLPHVDTILDTVRGSAFAGCVSALKPGGRLITVVSTQPTPIPAIFFYADATTARLRTLTTLFDDRRISARVGSVLQMSEARRARHACRCTAQARQACLAGQVVVGNHAPH
jgi:NADPH:quinone reductase-like Zn-dependent oxidoreductase